MFLCSSAVSDVPTINIDTTNKPKSFSKNWPGTTEIAGNPRDASKTPGVVSMNDNVVKKSPVESTPPKIASLGEKLVQRLTGQLKFQAHPENLRILEC